jgi:hypothetical protein
MLCLKDIYWLIPGLNVAQNDIYTARFIYKRSIGALWINGFAKKKLSSRQKGFVPEASCFNVHILNEIITAAKGNKGMTSIQLDVSKAFDTIPLRS